MALEEVISVMKDMLANLQRKQEVHEAVCLERQKTMFNTLAALASRIDKIDNKLGGWQSALIGIQSAALLGMIGYMWTHKLFG